MLKSSRSRYDHAACTRERAQSPTRMYWIWAVARNSARVPGMTLPSNLEIPSGKFQSTRKGDRVRDSRIVGVRVSGKSNDAVCGPLCVVSVLNIGVAWMSSRGGRTTDTRSCLFGPDCCASRGSLFYWWPKKTNSIVVHAHDRLDICGSSDDRKPSS